MSKYSSLFFFGKDNPEIPVEIAEIITSHVSPEDCANLGAVNTQWQHINNDNEIWRQTGAKDYQDFAKRIQLLNSEILIQNVINGDYDLATAEKAQKTFDNCGPNVYVYGLRYNPNIEACELYVNYHSHSLLLDSCKNESSDNLNDFERGLLERYNNNLDNIGEFNHVSIAHWSTSGSFGKLEDELTRVIDSLENIESKQLDEEETYSSNINQP